MDNIKFVITLATHGEGEEPDDISPELWRKEIRELLEEHYYVVSVEVEE